MKRVWDSGTFVNNMLYYRSMLRSVLIYMLYEIYDVVALLLILTAETRNWEHVFIVVSLLELTSNQWHARLSLTYLCQFSVLAEIWCGIIIVFKINMRRSE